MKTVSEMTYIVSSGALNSTPTNQRCQRPRVDVSGWDNDDDNSFGLNRSIVAALPLLPYLGGLSFPGGDYGGSETL